MKRAIEDQATNNKTNFAFFHACLDRINQIITERNAKITKADILEILRTLSYYRPKEVEQKEKMRKEKGILHQHEIQDDIISVRHKALIKEKSGRFRTVTTDMFNFLNENLSKGFFKDMFTQFDEE